jgi:hypothetical protein
VCGVPNCPTAAALAWDAILLKTKVALDVIADQLMLTMVEKSKRGGLIFIGAKRDANANNECMHETKTNKKALV